MELIKGGVPDRDDPVTVTQGGKERRAIVVGSGFKSHVLRNEVSVRYADGSMDLVPLEHVRPAAPEDPR